MEAYLIATLVVAAGLGFIPASIAKNKGYSFGLWWFYGWMLFIVAIIHVSLIPDKNAQQIPITNITFPLIVTSLFLFLQTNNTAIFSRCITLQNPIVQTA